MPLAVLGVENPTLENIKGHVQKHIEFTDEATAAAVVQGQEEKADTRINREKVDVDENLRWIVTQARLDAEDRIAAGGKSGITIDHGLKATAELTRRQHQDSQISLLGELVGGIGHALANPVAPRQIEEAVIDVEAVEV